MKCLNCGKIVKRGHGYKTATKYCSYKCYQEKPPKVVEIENHFKDNIKNILKHQEKSTCSIDTKSALMGITKQTYYKYKRKYLKEVV